MAPCLGWWGIQEGWSSWQGEAELRECPHAQRVPYLDSCASPFRGAQTLCPASHTPCPSIHHLQFVKVPSNVAPSVIFNLLLTEWHLPAPNLVVSLEGEERPMAVRAQLRDVLRHGLVKAAQSTGAPTFPPWSPQHGSSAAQGSPRPSISAPP